MVNYELLDYSLIITILGVSIYWFGMLFTKNSSYKVDKKDDYFYGTLFVMQYIFLPIAAFNLFRYYLLKDDILPHISTAAIHYASIAYLISLFILLIILIHVAHSVIKLSFGLKNRKIISYIVYELIPLLCCFIIVPVTYRSLFFSTHYELPFTDDYLFNFLLSLIVLSAISMIVGFGHAKFSSVTVITKTGSRVGKLWKHDDYLHLIVNDKKIKINNDSIIEIEYNTEVNSETNDDA
jgi:hypothetical protein